MDRNTLTGLSLMFLIMLGWLWYMTPSDEQLERMREERLFNDSLRTHQSSPEFREPIEERTRPDQMVREALSGIFAEQAESDTLIYTVTTPLYHVRFTNLGAGPNWIELEKYSKWDGVPVQMIADTLYGAYSLGFVSAQNYNIETRQILFRQETIGSGVTVRPGTSSQLRYVLEPEPGKRLVYTYTFNADNYDIGLEIHFDGFETLLSDRNVDFTWVPRLRTTERSRASEAMYKSGYIYMGGMLDKIMLSNAGREEKIFTGQVDWVSSKTKFFTQIIKPVTPGTGAVITGEVNGEPSNELTQHSYSTSIRTRIPDNRRAEFQLYIGPLEYYAIREFDDVAYDMVDVGYGWMNWFSKPFVKYAILPLITMMGDWLGNYGLAIILFALIIKIVLYPLTKKSFESMAAMRELQPEMKILQEKYKEDPKKQQEATMALFKKAKVNPLGGCLPNLLQIPVLITLWRFFQNAIEIRGESFLWASDLSAPDSILQLPFTIPFMGDFIGGFVLLMSASMVVQMRVSGQGGAANPQMKVLQYIFPVMMLLIFNQLSSGLSLYYLVYNLLSIGQQFMINKRIDHTAMMEVVDKKTAKEMKKQAVYEAKKKPRN